jgi:hypothetical protein
MATKNLPLAELLKLRTLERKRLDEYRQKDFERGRVTHSAATDDALSRMLLVDDLITELEEGE